MAVTSPAPSAAAPVEAPRAPLAPGPQGRAIVRALLRIQRSPLDAMDHYAAHYGDVVRFDLAGGVVHFVRGAEQVKRVLVTNQDNYGKSNQYELLTRVLGLGLVTNEGPSWQRQRALVQPMFAKRHLAPFADHMGQAGTATLAQWERDHPEGARVEMVQEMSALTLDVVGRALVGADFSDRANEFGVALGEVLHNVGAAGRSVVVQAGVRLPGVSVERAFRAQVPRWRAFAAGAEVLDEIVEGLIDRRLADAAAGRTRSDEQEDLLGLLMSARDEAGEPMTRTQVRDELMTFVTAGHETTANGLAWMWMLLSQHPEARERLFAEVDEVLEGRTPTAQDAERLPWTTACFEEAMRLYPPVWHVQRQARAADVVGGYHVPARSVVIVSTWLTHRDPAAWPNPVGFDPRRFLGDAPKQRPRHAYFPFGGGRRVCVGQGFAMLEAVLLAAIVAQRFTFDLVPGARIVPDPTVTLRPLHGLPMTMQRRRGAVST